MKQTLAHLTPWRATAIGIVVVALSCVCWLVLRNPMGAILSLLSDDAFYYFKIAQNINGGAGCTFDGIAPTNGFHPLWMLFLTAVFGIAGSSLIAPALVVIGVGFLICIAVLVLLYRLIEKFVAPGYGAVAVAACLLPNVLTAMTNGLETGLEIMMILIIMWYVYQHGALDADSSRSRALMLGVLLGIATLCRLDAVFLFLGAIAMTIASMVILRPAPNAGPARLLLIGAGFGLAVTPYFVWNLVEFGHLTPISGAVKSTFPSISENAFKIGGDKKFGAVAISLLTGILALLFLTGPMRERTWRAILCSPLAMLALACFMHFVHTVLFLDWGVYWWHYALYGLALAIAIAKLAHRATARRAWTRRLAVTALVAVFVTVAAATQVRILKIKGQQHGGWLQAAEWARDHTPPGSVFAINDAGLFGYFSRRPTINLDGKANGYEYLRSLKADEVEDYLTRNNTAYVASLRGRYYGGRMRITIPRTNQTIASILVSQENEVFRSREIPSHVGRFRAARMTHFYIWKYVSGLGEP
jgi:hypothetical protein